MRRVLLLLQARVLEAVRIKDGRIAIFVLSILIENHANFLEASSSSGYHRIQVTLIRPEFIKTKQ